MRQKNPLLIVLGVCGGCVLIGIIVFAVLAAIGMKKGGGMISGIKDMVKNPPIFLADLKAHNYLGAAAMIDPETRKTISAEKLQHLEEAAEKKMGPLQSFPQTFDSQSTNQELSQSGELPTAEYIYKYTLTYKKGTAVATFKFKSKDVMHMTGMITDFTLEPVKQ